MRVNGLYGHVRSNDARSLALFAGFVAAFHVLAALALVVPLAMLDPGHAPLYDWTGYFVRWAPIVTILGVLLFAAQMAWHVRVVRRHTDFRFVDDAEEPRLFRIVEPLAIAAGLPMPSVGVIDSAALNAFACGIRRKDAVLVFTRGLIDGLDDDELASVAAHEIMHIVNGDIRLIAATNVCLDTLKLLQQRRNPKRANRVWEALNLPILAMALPLLLVLLVVVSFLRQLAVKGSHLTRLLIASAREFIADAEAVRLTHNPAALVSALRRIEGRSAIPGLAAGQDAMMIDGAHEGAMATHPTIAQRIAAIVAVTGSVALIAPARRDTRPPAPFPAGAPRAGGAFGRRAGPLPEPASRPPTRRGAIAALVQVSPDNGLNHLGLTREMTFGLVAAIAAFFFVHGADLGRPGGLARAFDPAPVRALMTMAGKGMSCQVQGIGWLLDMAEEPSDCEMGSFEEMLAGGPGQGGAFGQMAEAMAGQAGSRGNGTFSNIPPAGAKLAQLSRDRCIHTNGYKVGDRGLHSVTETSENFSLPRWLAHGDKVAREVAQASVAARDAALLAYFTSRKNHAETIHHHFGNPGLQAAQARYATPVHQNAVAALRQRLVDPAFAPDVSPLERAEMELLAADPLDFVTCTRRREAA